MTTEAKFYEQGQRVARRERRWAGLRLKVYLLRERLGLWILPRDYDL